MIYTDGCYYDANGCMVCPQVDAVPAVPTTVETVPVVGWNAGANSVKVLDGNLQTQFSLPAGIAAIAIGLKTSRASNTVPGLIEHGLYFQSLNGMDAYQVIERGTTKTTAITRAATDVFTIRRVGRTVSYLVNDVVIYTSTSPSTGTKLVNACLYASGDQVGASA